jgi:hypothetical protein
VSNGQSVVDTDDPSSRPSHFAERVHELANHHRGSTDEVSDPSGSYSRLQSLTIEEY